MVKARQAWGIVSVTVGLGLLVIGDADSLAPWRLDPQAAGSEEEQTKSPMPSMGVLVGRVTRGPASSIESLAGQLGPSPVSNIRIVISSGAGETVTSVTTDTHGDYRIDLPTGTYRVDIGPLAGMEYTKDLPAVVAVSAGRETRLDLYIDTGIR
jgi:hypothetical protein